MTDMNTQWLTHVPNHAAAERQRYKEYNLAPEYRCGGFNITADYFGPISVQLAQSMNGYYQEFPGQGFRVYGHDAYDLAFLKQMPDLRHLTIQYFTTVENIEVISGLKKLESLEIEVSQIDDFEFLHGLPHLNDLRLIKPSKGSVRPSVKVLASLPKLQKLFVLGYAKGIASVRDCHALKQVQIQQMKVETWDLLPPQGLDRACYSFLKGPAGLKDLVVNAEEFSVIGMKPENPLTPNDLFSTPLDVSGTFSIGMDIYQANTLFETPDRNGHTWARMIDQEASGIMKSIEYDAEADGCYFYGKERALNSFRKKMTEILNKASLQPDRFGVGCH